ncbi:MAG: hypothetical protein JKX76_02525 [Colwellia sp.]|nr:hypothetical protein [Colwellia sp.]
MGDINYMMNCVVECVYKRDKLIKSILVPVLASKKNTYQGGSLIQEMLYGKTTSEMTMRELIKVGKPRLIEEYITSYTEKVLTPYNNWVMKNFAEQPYDDHLVTESNMNYAAELGKLKLLKWSRMLPRDWVKKDLT